MQVLRPLIIVLVGLLTTSAGAFAQFATIEYADDLSQVSAAGQDGAELSVTIGGEIPAGSSVETGDTGLELRVHPSETLLKLAPNTRFTLERIDVGSASVDHAFFLSSGKLRTVVQSTRGNRYRIRTPNAVSGVRGTDFAQRVVPGETDWVCVWDGEVTFARLSDGTRVEVARREFADIFADQFTAREISEERIQELFADVQFVELEPDD